MPSHHHQTVDRVVEILETVADQPRGMRLTDLVRALHAPKSSVQMLVDGLVASGYLFEQDHKYAIGPGVVILGLKSNVAAMQIVSHERLRAIHMQVGCNTMVGIRVGDSLVYVDQVGDGPMMEFLAYSHRRRPLFTTATGKAILAHLPASELQEVLVEAERHDPETVAQFIDEMPGIQQTGLAFNRGVSMPGLFAVATAIGGGPNLRIQGICANGDAGIAERLEEVGARLLDAVRKTAVEI